MEVIDEARPFPGRALPVATRKQDVTGSPWRRPCPLRAGAKGLYFLRLRLGGQSVHPCFFPFGKRIFRIGFRACLSGPRREEGRQARGRNSLRVRKDGYRGVRQGDRELYARLAIWTI